jgi:hypothetical protein
MKANDFAKEVCKIVLKTERKIKDLEKIEISGDKMINSDFEKAIMAMGFTEIKELFNKLKRSK